MKGRRCNHGKGVCGPDPEGIEDPGAGTREDPGTGAAGPCRPGVPGAGGGINRWDICCRKMEDML